tara:strand:+ start:1086 stop:2060 length:975 start_codon:yes stop_codon:yes gene_type:complete
MLSGNIKLYNLPTDILDKICYENDLDNKKLALLIMTHKSFHKFIMIKYNKLYLSSLQELQININGYRNIYEVDIYNCLGIIDTYIFENCKILKLRCCQNITDVSKLGNVEYLDLADCDEITNVSMLGKCKYLDLSNCNKITNVNNLGNVEHLDLSYCYKLTNISKLGNHKYLSLRGCNKIENINNLDTVHKLDLSYCENIRNISPLSNVYSLDVSHCPNIRINLTMRTTIFRAMSTDLTNRTMAFLKNVKELNIKNCLWVTDLSKLSNIEKLDIRGCKRLRILSPVNNLKNISLSRDLYNKNNIFNQLKSTYSENNCEIDIDYF